MSFATLRGLIGGLLWATWLGFTLWMLSWGMVFSACWAALFAWNTRPWQPLRKRRALVLFVVGIGLVGVVGLPEYASTANQLHCRTLGFTGKQPAAHTGCTEQDLAEGRTIAREGGHLFSLRERLAVHGFNLLMALGGYATGLPEVADETLWLSTAADPLAEEGGVVALSAAKRVRQCEASRGRATALAAEVRKDSDFILRSGVVRGAVAKALPRLGDKAGAKATTRGLHWVKDDSYLWSLQHDSARVALALEVADSRAELERREDGRVTVRWTGHMHYPPEDINLVDLPLPTLLGPTRLRLSETIFCGMHIDGAMNPYFIVWETVIDADDPRLSGSARHDSEASLLHQAAGLLLGLL